MQTSDSTTAVPAAALYLTDLQLIEHRQNIGAPLPFGLTRLRQDRKNGCLGGVPHRKMGGKLLYDPDEVSRFLNGLPIIQAKPPKTATKTGRPSAAESAEAARRGITVQQLRGGAA